MTTSGNVGRWLISGFVKMKHDDVVMSTVMMRMTAARTL